MGWWYWHDKQTNIQPSEPTAETEGRTTTTSADTSSSGIWMFVLCQCLRTSSRWLLRSLHLKSTKSNRVTVALSVRLTRMYSLVRVFLPWDMACSLGIRMNGFVFPFLLLLLLACFYLFHSCFYFGFCPWFCRRMLSIMRMELKEFEPLVRV